MEQEGDGMSKASTHAARSHKTKRRYKPTNKTILNKEAKKRHATASYFRGIMRSITFGLQGGEE